MYNTEYRLKHYRAVAAKLEKKIAVLKDVIFGYHASRLASVRHEASKLQQMLWNKEISLKEFEDRIEPLVKEEKLCIKMFNRSRNPSNIENLVKMETELSDIKSEIWSMERVLSRGIGV